MSSGAFALLNGYDPAQTYAAGVSAAEAALPQPRPHPHPHPNAHPRQVSEAEAAAAVAAEEGEKLAPPAEAAHAAAQEELVRCREIWGRYEGDVGEIWGRYARALLSAQQSSTWPSVSRRKAARSMVRTKRLS